VKLHDWNKIITAAYNEYMKDVDPHDVEACNARMKPIRDDLHTLAQDDVSSQVPPAARMRTGMQQLTLIVSAVGIMVSHNFMTDNLVSG
jgi:hypothetical protein